MKNTLKEQGIHNQSHADRNRSFLAGIGSRSLGLNEKVNKKMNESKIDEVQKIQKYNNAISIKEQDYEGKKKQSQLDRRTRQLIIKLTLPRLRKMQALVRGFLTRRIIYPPLLEQYLVGKSILNLITSNIVYKQSSAVILQYLTYLKYEPEKEDESPELTLMGTQKKIQNLICNGIIKRIFQKQLKSVAELAVIEHAKLITRPKVTYGFNLRDPLELFLFDVLNTFVGMNYKEIVREAIDEAAKQKRQIRVIDQWIDKHHLLHPLLHELVEQALNESMSEYILENMLNRINEEGANVVARVVLQAEEERRQEENYGQIYRKCMEWILEESSIKAILDLGHGLTK